MHSPVRHLAVLLAALAMQAAHADITIGISLPLTGPGAALGMPLKNSLEFWPDKIAGEKLRVIVLDDGSDPTNAVKNVRKMTLEDNVDVIAGSALTTTALAVSQVASESETVQMAWAPIEVPAEKQKWIFRLPQPISLMADAVVADMKARGFKTLGFIGYNDPWGEVWLKEVTKGLAGSAIQIVASERYNRPDTSVTGQVVKLLAAKPDAVLVAGSGAGAALPQMTLVERGYKGLIYQTHAAGSHDVIRVGGKAMEGAIMPVGPVLVAEQLAENHPARKAGLDYVRIYEAKYGKGSRTQFGAHAFDTMRVLERIVPVALKAAKPGTKEFRAALRDALESQRDITASQGVYNYTAGDHFGLDQRGRVLVRIENGDFRLLR
ncbi:MAG: ABC transporter substrate-binding protein [Rhodocyclales bacterium]|nr:ABC transporter substrate-binding protein [Rhodocyclales bacterium]